MKLRHGPKYPVNGVGLIDKSYTIFIYNRRKQYTVTITYLEFNGENITI